MKSKKVAKKKKDKNNSSPVAKHLLNVKSVTFQFNPPYTFTSGLKGPMYIDNRIVLSYPKVRKAVVDHYVKVIKKEIGLKNIDYISATATAAIPQGALVAEQLRLPMVYVRPSTKSYGKGQKVEGYLKKGSRVLVIEDHISTAASVINNVLTIRALGSKVKHVITTTALETKRAKDLLKKNKVKLIPLTTGRLIIEEGLKNGYISREERDIVLEWIKSPEKWSQKYGRSKS